MGDHEHQRIKFFMGAFIALPILLYGIGRMLFHLFG